MDVGGEDEEDLEAIQAHMAMTMALTYQAVEASMKNSTLPDEQVYEPLSTFKPRPPRMGIGDMRERKVESTLLARDTARLHGRLAGKKRAREEDEGDVASIGTVAPLMNGVKKLKVSATTTVRKGSDDDDEEEESRTATISAKGTKQTNGPIDRFAIPANKKKNKKQKTEVGEGKMNGNIAKEEGRVFAVPAFPNPKSESIKAKSIPKPIKEKSTSPDEKPVKEASKTSNLTIDVKSTTVELGAPRSSSSSNARQSPVISLSSSTSRYSRDVEKRLLLKQEALASWRLVKVEKVAQVNPEPSIEKQGGSRKADLEQKRKREMMSEEVTNKSKSTTSASSRVDKRPVQPNVPVVLQLEPVTEVRRDDQIGNGMEANEEQQQQKKKKRKRKKNKKKHQADGGEGGGAGSQQQKNVNDDDDEDSD